MQSLKETGFDEEDGTKINEVAKALAEVGVQLVDDQGNFRNFGTVLDEVGARWDTLSSRQKAYVATTTAGSYQSARFLSLMDDYSTSVNLYQGAMNSAGVATDKFNLYQESTQAHLNKMKTALEGLWSTTFQSDTIRSVIDATTSLLSALDSVAKKFGGVNTIVVLATTAFLAFNRGLRMSALAMFGVDLKAVALATQIFTGSTIAARAAVFALQATMTLGLSLAIAGIVAGLTHLLNKQREQKELNEKLAEQNKTIVDSWNTQQNKIQELVATYSQLKEATKDGSVFADIAQEEAYKKTIEDLSALMPNLVDSIDEKGNKHLKNADAIREEIIATEELTKATNKQSVLDAEKNFSTQLDDIKSIQKEISDIQAKIAIGGNIIANGMGGASILPFTESELNKFQIQILTLQRKISTSAGSIKEDLSGLTKNILTLNGVKIDENISAQLSEIVKSVNLDGLNGKELADKGYLIADFITQLNVLKNVSTSNEKYQGLVEGITTVGKSFGMTDYEVQKLIGSLKETVTTINAVLPKTDEVNAVMKDLNDSFKSATDSVSPLNAAIQKLRQGKSLTADEITNLIEKVDGFSSAVTTENGVLKVNLKAVTTLRDKSVQSFDDMLKAKKAQVKDLETQTNKELEKYGIQIDGIKSVAEALQALAKKKTEIDQDMYAIRQDPGADESGKAYMDILKQQRADIAATEESIRVIDGAKKQLNDLMGISTDVLKSVGKSTDDNTESNRENYDSISDTVEILTDLQKSLIAIQKLRDEEENKRSRMRKGSQEYRDSLAKENKLIQEQIKLRKQGIDNPSQLVSTKITTTVKTKAGEDSTSSSSSSAVSNMLNVASALQGQFKYKQVAGEYKGTFDQFVEGATSDCSQFVQEMFKEFLKTTLPRTAAEQAKQGVAISKEQLQAGDLVFFNTTGKDNSHVGIYQGNGKFIQMGNSGLKESDLNSSYWSSKYQGARRIIDSVSTSTPSSSTGNSTSKNGGTTIKTNGATAKEMQDAVDAAIVQNTADANAIYQNNLLQLDSVKEKYERLVASVELQIETSKKVQDTLDPNSVEWRTENNKQINLQTQIQSLKAQQKSNLQTMMKSLGVSSDEYDDYLKQLSTDWLDVQAEKIVKLTENINSQIANFNDQISKTGEEIDISNAKLELMVEGSAEYRKEILSQIPVLQKQQELRKKEISFIEEQLKNEKLTIASKKELSNQLHQLELDWLNNEKAIKSATKSLIDFSSKALSSLFDSLKSSLSPSSLLDLSEFSDSIDSIIATLDEADKKYLTNVSFVDTTSSTRSDLSGYASKVKDIAAQVKSALTYYQDMDNVSFGNLSSLSAQINSQVALISSLKTKLDEVNNTVRDTELQYSKEEAALSELIKTREKYYDSQIKSQQDILDSLDEQIEKEDRLKALQDINDELNKVKNDKRFEYVTESGELILTYDKARVDELEQQKNDLVKQYEREDVKKAIQDEIDRLQAAKDSEIEILNDNLEKTKAIHQANLDALKLYQSSLSSLYDQTVSDTQNKLDQFQAAVQQGLADGTITASEATTLLESVVNSWQNQSLSNWDTYINQVILKFDKLKQLYAELANSANAALSQSTATSTDSVALDPALAAKMEAEKNAVISTPVMEEKQEAIKGRRWDGEKWVYYHTGGEVGKPALKSNEVPTILENDELVLTKNHQDILKNMFARSRDIVGTVMSGISGAMSGITFNKSTPAVAGAPSYTFTGPITVKADNPTEFLTGLEHLITSQRR